MTEKTLERAADAIADVVYRFDQLAGAKSALAGAQALVALQNAVSDLASWHPDYDDEEQRIRRLYDDEQETADEAEAEAEAEALDEVTTYRGQEITYRGLLRRFDATHVGHEPDAPAWFAVNSCGVRISIPLRSPGRQV